jgi:hypothetical protein
MKKKATARAVLEKEVTFLKSVIWDHAMMGLAWKYGADPTQLDKGETAWLVSFGDKNTDQVRMFVGKCHMSARIPNRERLLASTVRLVMVT